MSKNFHYKDIGQHGHAFQPAPVASVFSSEPKPPKQKPAATIHRKRTLKSTTLTRPKA